MFFSEEVSTGYHLPPLGYYYPCHGNPQNTQHLACFTCTPRLYQRRLITACWSPWSEDLIPFGPG